MNDLKFWRLLHEKPGTELVPFLLALADRPLKERIPYLGLLPKVLKAEAPELRDAALWALQGAGGRRALQLLVDHFQDPDLQVAGRAVESFARSITSDPLRWAHAVFHPRMEVRRIAAAQKETSGLAIHLLCDPDCSGHVRLPQQVEANTTPTLLEWLHRGLLDTTLARGLLTHSHMVWLLERNPVDGRNVRRLLAAFWDDEGASVRFWDRLGGWLEHTLHEGHRSPMTDLLIELGRERGEWPAHVRRLLFGLRPQALCDPSIPREARYHGLETLYRGKNSRRLADLELLDLLRGDLVRYEGRLDLWALGAVLSTASQPHELLEEVAFAELVEAAAREPLRTAFLFLSSRQQSGDRRSLARRLAKAVNCGPAVAAGLLAAGDTDGAQPYLRNQLSEVFLALLALETMPGFRLSPKRRSLLIEFMIKPLLASPDCLLGARGPLAQECLTELAGKMEAEDFLGHCLRLPEERLAYLLETIERTPGFPYATEGLLAVGLSQLSHPVVRAWCEARTAAANASSGRRPPSAARRLSEADAAAIESCLEPELPLALRPALLAPALNLIEALSARCPGTHRSTVTLALIGCHDGIERVAAEMARFGPVGDNEAVAWSYQPDLPLHGHCWLDRFDFHSDRVEQCIDSLDDLMALARAYSGPIVNALWRMMARLCSRWRFRDREKLARMVGVPLVALMVEGLEGENQHQAAICLSRLWQAEKHTETLVLLRARVQSMLPDLDHETRMELHGYVNSRGLASTTVRRRGQSVDDQELDEVRRSVDLEQLSRFAHDARGDIAAEAALRLLDFGEVGASLLLDILSSEAAPQAPLLAETAGLWPAGPSRQTLLAIVGQQDLVAEVVFAAGLSLLEVGSPTVDSVLAAVCRPAEHAWFLRSYWDRLLRCGIGADRLSRELAGSPHPHAYAMAVETALEQGLKEPLVTFLESGWDRHAATRLQVARRLWEMGDARGFPLLFPEALERPDRSLCLERVDLRAAVDSVMLAGNVAFPEQALVDFMLALPPEAYETVAPLVLRQSRRPETCQAVLNRLPRTARRQELLSKVAHTFVWGVKIGRQLTGRLFHVEMHGGEELGFTRLEESRIFVNPLPMFRGDRHGQEIVEGLILHELGHHLYHRGPEEAEVWREAQDKGLHPLLNLVSDEHLERNLRALNPSFDQKLKRLAAYAFLHDKREVEIGDLLVSLQHQALAVLKEASLGVANKAGRVSLRSGDILAALERHGSSFIRFVRGLRTGRGNRHGDPLVAQGLSLFTSTFRDLSLKKQYPIAQKLREIFGAETDLIKVLSQDAVFTPDSTEVIVVGEGLTPDEMRREMDRIAKGQNRPEQPGTGARWINKCQDPSFPPLTTIMPVPYEPSLAREYIRGVARHAHRLREVFCRLGLAYRRENRRMKGHRVDRSRLSQAILRGDVRILESRRLVVDTDLFLGVLVDCSGSMHGDCIHKARLFATLVAQAVNGLEGVDLRVLGFTDSVIYDAGDANRCTAHSLLAGGGNNDAGALDYAAGLARRSRRRARLLIMISDGLPTQCSVQALTGLVERLGRKEKILCAQVAVRPLKEVCFPHYMELVGGPDSLGVQVAEFGKIVARLASRTLR